MERIAVSLRVPALGQTCEFLIPDSMTAGDGQELMIRILSSEYGIHGSGDYAVLIDLKDHTQLLPDRSFCSQGIRDGAELMLV